MKFKEKRGLFPARVGMADGEEGLAVPVADAGALPAALGGLLRYGPAGGFLKTPLGSAHRFPARPCAS